MFLSVVHKIMERLHPSTPLKHAWILRYSLAVALTIVALGVRLAILPTEAGVPFVTFFPAAALAAILGGLGPGLLATAIGAFLGSYFFLPPSHGLSNVITVLIFIADEIVVCAAMEALHRYYEQVRRKNMELNDLVERLADANNELERFAYVASHDLQEPLRKIISSSQLLERRQTSALADDSKECLSYIAASASKMNSLISDLLAFSRVTSQGIRFTTVSTSVACLAAIDHLQPQIAATGAEVNVGTLPDVVGDGIQLMQIFQNMIGNSINFRSSERPSRINIRCEQKGDEWLFSIIDNGIGFDAAKQNVFELFSRQHRQADYPGLGLGLAVCKRIIRRHGGRIWAESHPGGGSTFCFTLPVVTEMTPELLEPREIY